MTSTTTTTYRIYISDGSEIGEHGACAAVCAADYGDYTDGGYAISAQINLDLDVMSDAEIEDAMADAVSELMDTVGRDLEWTPSRAQHEWPMATTHIWTAAGGQ